MAPEKAEAPAPTPTPAAAPAKAPTKAPPAKKKRVMLRVLAWVGLSVVGLAAILALVEHRPDPGPPSPASTDHARASLIALGSGAFEP